MSFQTEALREWAWIEGQFRLDDQWLLSNLDTWERNPHYHGPDQGHPEDAIMVGEYMPQEDSETLSDMLADSSVDVFDDLPF